MKRLAIILSLLLMFPAPMLAQDSPNSTTRADDCGGLARACTGAARELKAARELIAGYEAHIAASDERIEVALKEILTLRRINALSNERAVELGNVIAAEREAKAALVKLKDEQAKRIAKLEKQLKRSRKTTWIVAGVAVVVGVLAGSR